MMGSISSRNINLPCHLFPVMWDWWWAIQRLLGPSWSRVNVLWNGGCVLMSKKQRLFLIERTGIRGLEWEEWPGAHIGGRGKMQGHLLSPNNLACPDWYMHCASGSSCLLLFHRGQQHRGLMGIRHHVQSAGQNTENVLFVLSRA